MQENSFNFIIGTKSKLKVSALDSTLKEHFPNVAYRIYSYNAPSGVPEQPFDDEGVTGATNRCRYAALEYSKENSSSINTYSIGIENFIRKDLNEEGRIIYKDLAAVCMFKLPIEKESDPFLFFSDFVRFDNEYVEAAITSGTTVGIIMKEKGIVSKSDDPHYDLTGKSRVLYLKEVLFKALSIIIK